MKIKKKAWKIISSILGLVLTVTTITVTSYAIQSSGIKTIDIDCNNVIQSDFYGVGTNVLPFSLMENNKSKGYSDAYFELEKQRFLRLKPSIVRVWTQIDWFVCSEDFVSNGGSGEHYKNGEYDFNSPNMVAFLKYMDMFKDAGSDVMLVTNWKVGTDIQDWFCIDGINTPNSSAPADIDAYSTACTAFVKFLYDSGYNNVKYISVANEPNLYDFAAHGDEYAYYIKTAKSLKSAINSSNLPIKMVGLDVSENSTTSNDWIPKTFKKDYSDLFDSYAYHEYDSVNISKTYLNDISNLNLYNKPLFLTEFGYLNSNVTYSSSHAGMVLMSALNGVNGALTWYLDDVYGENPLSGEYTLGGDMGMWYPPQNNDSVKDIFYEISLLTNYIPAHSKVVSTGISGSLFGSDSNARAATFTDDSGNITIITELAKSSADTLKININGLNLNGKKIYKHVYKQNQMEPDGNAIIPVTSKIIDGTQLITDEVDTDCRRVIVYTTIPEKDQMIMNHVTANVGVGGSLSLVATTVNGNNNIGWEVINGGGSVSDSGVYKADTGSVSSGETVAIKAYSLSDPKVYGITVITIK